MQLKNYTAGLFVILFLTISVSPCDEGYYSAARADGGGNICYQCADGAKSCTDFATITAYLDEIDGVDSTPAPICGAYFYRKGINGCGWECKEGCSECVADYDFCTSCDPGYVWNADYTCLPSVVGLLGATLVLLVIGVVAIIIAFVKVNAALK